MTESDDVYSFLTRNGVIANDNIGFNRRVNHTSVVFDDKMWLTGGSQNRGFYSDVWYSNDGINYQEREPSTLFIFEELVGVSKVGAILEGTLPAEHPLPSC